MKIFRSYLKGRLLLFAGLFLIIAVFNITLFLYRVNLEIIIYASILALCLIFLLIYLDFKKYQAAYKTIKALDAYYDELPKTRDVIISEYEAKIAYLKEELKKEIAQKDREQKELSDYYDLWVHQIKTPIAALHLILDEKKDLDLEIELLRIEEYVNMVLNYTRLKGSDYVIKKVNVKDIIAEVLKELAPFFIRKKLSLYYEPKDLIITSDKKWLHFVLAQILSNALKYTKEGYIKIELDDQSLTISDTGQGIAKEDLPRVFDKAFSGLAGRRDQRASGIGLYLSKAILDTLHHSITITSQIDKGTKVKIDFKEKRKFFD